MATRTKPTALPDTLQFLGAAGTVTGSKYLIRSGGRSLLLDCGMFQGLKALRLRNWAQPAFDAGEVEAVVLSHAHLDHSGYLPLLVRNGFSGPIYCTAGTADLLRILLLDAAHLQESEAEFANRRGFSKHKPALPLFTTADAEAALRLRRVLDYDRPNLVLPGVEATLRRAGHILGSATVDLALETAAGPQRLAFSGDLGRWGRPILRDPEMTPEADILLVESTYGDRVHGDDPEDRLAEIIHEVARAGSTLVVPAFAVGRTQELLWILRQLEDSGRIPSLPVFVDSPMAIDATEIYLAHPEEHDLDMAALADRERSPLHCRHQAMLRTPQESKSLNEHRGPMILISASGMATGGRVLHHLKRLLPEPGNIVLLSGFQAAGTRGRSLQDGATEIRIHGSDVPVRARVMMLDGLSAHGDRKDILRWLRGFRRPPRQTYVVHGEAQQSDRLAATIRNELGWNARVAEDQEIVALA